MLKDLPMKLEDFNSPESLLELYRFPLLVVIPETNSLDYLYSVHKAFSGFVEEGDSSVLFRLGNKTDSDFNDYVKKNNLNSPLDKDKHF